MEWTHKKFDELTVAELYDILRLRNEVFAVEQNCVYPDMDYRDQPSVHLMGRRDNKLVAYARIIPPDIAYPEPSIGRVVTAPVVRRSGTGRELMQRSIQLVRDLYGDGPVKIGAQYYLKEFYSSFGFRQTSDIYPEDGIEHIEMLLS